MAMRHQVSSGENGLCSVQQRHPARLVFGNSLQTPLFSEADLVPLPALLESLRRSLVPWFFASVPLTLFPPWQGRRPVAPTLLFSIWGPGSDFQTRLSKKGVGSRLTWISLLQTLGKVSLHQEHLPSPSLLTR